MTKRLVATVLLLAFLQPLALSGQSAQTPTLPPGLTIPMLLDYGEFNRNGERVFTLLPNLPPNSPNGQVAGLQAGPEFVVDLKWTQGELDELVLHLAPSLYKLRCQINYRDRKAIVEIKHRTKVVNLRRLFFSPSAARLEAIAQTLSSKPRAREIPLSDRPAWAKLADLPNYRQLLRQADEFIARPPAQPNESNYLLFSQTGERADYYKDGSAADLNTLVAAECLTATGKYLPAIEREIRTYCGLRTWTYGAHDLNLIAFYNKGINIDLYAPRKAVALAQALYILQDRLPPDVLQLMRKNVMERVLTPFRQMIEGATPMEWWFGEQINWNSHCLEGIVETALTLIDDPRERAFYIAVAEHYIQNYLELYPSDGYCGEGVNYWNLGYGSFVRLAELVAYASDRQIDWFELPRARNAALYGDRIRLYRDVIPWFSDCSIKGLLPDRRLMHYLSRKLQQPIGPKDLQPDDAKYPETIAQLPPCEDDGQPLPERSYFADSTVLIARPGPMQPGCRLAAALKGNHNGEPHNHNDVGSFVLTADRVPLIVDPGKEEYSSLSFQNLRYTRQLNNSFGHSVPVIAGKLQSHGLEARAKEVRSSFSDTRDELVLDIKQAYPVSELTRLERTLIYNRTGAGQATLADEFAFSSPQSFESALICFGSVAQLDPNTLQVSRNGATVAIRIDSGGEAFEVDQNLLEGNKIEAFRRIAVRLTSPVLRGRVAFTIHPL